MLNPSVQANKPVTYEIPHSASFSERSQAPVMSDSVELLRQFVAQTPTAIAMLDRQMRYLLVSDRWAIDLKLGDRPLQGRSHPEIFPETGGQLQEIFQRCLTGEIEVGKQRTREKNGQWVKWEMRPWRNNQGDIAGVMLWAQIDPKSEAAESWTNRTPLLETHSDSRTNGILVVDDRAGVISYNSHFVQLWQIPESVLQTQGDRVLREWMLAGLKNPQEFLTKVEYFDGHPWEISHDEIELKDGRICDRYTAPLISLDGNTYGRIWVFRDITQAKSSQNKLRHSEQLYRTLAQNFPQGAVILFDRNLRYTIADGKGLADVGIEANRIIGKTIWEIFDRATCEALEPVYRAALAGETHQFEMPYEDRVYEVQVLPVKNDRAEIFAGMVVTHEITERKKAESALRQGRDKLEELVKERTAKLEETNERLKGEIIERVRTQAEFDRIFNLSLDMLIVADTDGYFKQVNPAVEKILGYSREEVLSIPFIELIHPDDRAATEAEFRQQIEQGSPAIKFENRYRCKDGSYRWLAWNSVPLVSEGLLYGVARDITENKAAEVALRNSEAREREKAERLAQILLELKQTQAQLLHSEKLSSLGQMVAGIAHEINNPVNFIYGNLSHIREYIQDLLGLLELYLEEYPSPAPSIREAMEAMDFEFMMEDLPNLLESMKMGSDRIREIVFNLRNFSRMDEAEMKPTDIHKGIESTLMILQNRLKARPDSPGIQVVKEFGELPMVSCYSGQLNQVFMNILANAIDALDEYNRHRSRDEINANPSIIKIRTTVTCSRWEKREAPGEVSFRDEDPHEFYAVISIADNGPGIVPEIGDKLFEPFFTTKPVGKGTGLGLAISYKIIVDKHGGHLWCKSEPGKGVEFCIEIPIRQLNEKG
ncbi:PAS domain S-box protein [Phormidium sp. CCY1219]|uniref:PAS domain S-box protein n=1 Tax=Phormidium sp. CCY1219 TaxID=2886104 RepID=UPI002D1F770F|nr:PAS domain S-box protein [Phormidium sp. CCY1219]MEB3830901.1 PAS domain S-box protein [Phormidium sp. CCY1219]